MVGQRLRVLIVEDSEDDAALLLDELRRGGFEPVWQRVDGAPAMRDALARGPWDVVVADHTMPGFSGLGALELLHESGLDIPFILLSGSMGEDLAVQAMKAGAHDYIMKGRLARLLPAIERELREAEMRAARRRAEETLRLLQKAVETIRLGVTITDARSAIVYVNPAQAEIQGYSVDELTGRDVRVFSPPEFWNPMTPARLKAMKSWVRERVNVSRDGRVYPVRLISDVVRDAKGEPVGLVTISEDITERTRAEEALRESEERYALAARAANDGLWDWNMRNNEMYLSPRWKDMLGYREEEIGRRPEEWLGRVAPQDLERLKRQIDAHLGGLTPQLHIEHRVRHRDGTYRWFLCRGVAVRDGSGKAQRLAGSQTDVTERKVAEEQLLHSAFYDGLTELPNRALFMDRLESSIRRARRHGVFLFAVLFLDLDRFKNVNDSLGHMLGDQLLVAIARRLEKCMRPGDTVARLGGDEFTLLLDDIRDISDAEIVAERIQRALAAPFSLEGNEVFISASIGIALSSAEYERPEDALRDSDTAMYRAKLLGKARHEVFDASMHARAMTLLQLETDLRRAFERSEFRNHYQPIVSLSKGVLVGFEALARWAHPQRGLVPPEDFIPLAEETGLIVPLGHWVLREACRQLKEWLRSLSDGGRLSVSVNLSGRQFAQPDLVERVQEVLSETGLEPAYLALEITESVLMGQDEAATRTLASLRSMNIGLHIDDFGTGYSSLSYLHRFPVDTLKIDRSFVDRLGTPDENHEIVRTIVSLAHSLGMWVLAEGVETADQLEQLRQLSCDLGQGSFFSPALEAGQAEALIAANPRW